MIFNTCEQCNRTKFIHLVVRWNHRHSYYNFMRLYRNEFKRGTLPHYRIYRIIKNTLNGRYREIEDKKYGAW